MNCLQYGVWADCCNLCEFCLRKNRESESNEQKISLISRIAENIKYQDWNERFSHGISLLGGELYYVTDKEVQKKFLELIDVIIENVFVSNNDQCKFSTVTNGLYNPEFLYQVIDKIVDAVGIEKIDLNFSYDFKYRFSTPKHSELVLKNINEFHTRYNYKVGVQMILTQYLIDMVKDGFEIDKWIDNNIPGNNLSFLYPHPIKSGKTLEDFNFKRDDFLWFMEYLKSNHYILYFSFYHSTKNSATFKWTGLIERKEEADVKQPPALSDGKEVINPSCGHSTLYQCYSDSDECMLCDLLGMEGEI